MGRTEKYSFGYPPLVKLLSSTFHCQVPWIQLPCTSCTYNSLQSSIHLSSPVFILWVLTHPVIHSQSHQWPFHQRVCPSSHSTWFTVLKLHWLFWHPSPHTVSYNLIKTLCIMSSFTPYSPTQCPGTPAFTECMNSYFFLAFMPQAWPDQDWFCFPLSTFSHSTYSITLCQSPHQWEAYQIYTASILILRKWVLKY